MVKIDFKIDEMSAAGIRSLENKSFYNGMQLGLKNISENLVETAREGIRNPPKSGKLYSLKGKFHQASAPGEYPAEISGRLRKSVGSIVQSLQMMFGADTPYAPFLQQTNAPNRTSSFTKIAPRPFLDLSHNRNSPTFQPIMKDRVLDTIERG